MNKDSNQIHPNKAQENLNCIRQQQSQHPQQYNNNNYTITTHFKYNLHNSHHNNYFYESSLVHNHNGFITHHNNTSVITSTSDTMLLDPSSLWRLMRFSKLGSSRIRFDDDITDRFNYQISAVIIFILISMTGVRQYFGKPIECFTPQEFTRGWEEYVESYCWVANTYFVPITGKFPKNSNKQMKISYYQWASIVLALQALLFCIPCMLWRILSVQSSFNLRRILQAAVECNSNIIHNEHSHKSIIFICNHLDKCLRRKKIYGTGLKARIKRLINHLSENLCLVCCCCCKRNSGNYLSVSYICVKMCYLLNVIGQMYLMQKFIDSKYSFYGLQVLLDLANGKEWTTSGHFPRVTFCDVETKKLGKNHLYTIQCVLPLNMFLEKIFIFLWFWHVFLMLINVLSTIKWLVVICSSSTRHKTIREYLVVLEQTNSYQVGCPHSHKHPSNQNPVSQLHQHHYPITKKEGPGGTRAFTNDYLQMDGVFIINLIAGNVSQLVAGEIVGELWRIFLTRRTYFQDILKKYEEPLDNTRYLYPHYPSKTSQYSEESEFKSVEFINNKNSNFSNNNNNNNDTDDIV